MPRRYYHLLLIAIIGVVSYSNSFHVPFQFDDFNNIADNPVIQRLDNFIFSTRGYAYNPRRFIGYLTLALNYRLGGADVFGYHLVNLFIHVVTAALVYFFVILTFRTPYFLEAGIGDQGLGIGKGEASPIPSPQSQTPALIALFSALLFVSHPLQTEAVTYIVQRFASLTAMFYLLSVVMYIKARLASQKAGKLTGYILSLLAAVCAMKTKENSFTLPIVVVLYEFMFFKTSFRKKLAFLVPLLLTIIIIPVSMIGVHRPLGEIISDLSEKTRLQTNIPRWDYLMTQMRVITTYIRLLFFPVNLNLDYDYPIRHSLFEAPVFLSFLFLTAIFATAVYLLYKSRQEARGEGLEGKTENLSPIAYRPLPIAPMYRLIAFGIFWFFIALSVESSFIPIVDVIFEHRVYLPSIGAFIAITTAVFVVLERFRKIPPLLPLPKGGFPPLWKRGGRGDFGVGDVNPSLFIAFFSVVVVAMSALTISRNAVWQDGISLWKDVQAKSPRNARAYNNLGYIYLERGQTDRALEYLLTAVSFRPGYADARDNLGVAYYDKGMFDVAIGQFRAAMDLQPGSADIHHNLGLAYVQMGLKDDALAEFEAALKIAPDNYEIYNDMGVVFREKGLTDMAIESFKKAIALRPDYAGAHYNLGLAYQSVGVSDKAMEHLNKAHLLDPQKF